MGSSEHPPSDNGEFRLASAGNAGNRVVRAEKCGKRKEERGKKRRLWFFGLMLRLKGAVNLGTYYSRSLNRKVEPYVYYELIFQW